MKLLRMPASGACSRICFTSARKLSVPPNRRIRRSTFSLECWNDMSK